MTHKYLHFILTGVILFGCKEPPDILIREGIRLEDKGDPWRNREIPLGNLNKILDMQGRDNKGFELIMNPDGPFATEEEPRDKENNRLHDQRSFV